MVHWAKFGKGCREVLIDPLMLLSLLPPSLLGGDPSLLRALGDPALRECTSSAPSADATLGRALERSLERSLERRGGGDDEAPQHRFAPPPLVIPKMLHVDTQCYSEQTRKQRYEAAELHQPSHATHPHLLRRHEVTPGLAASEYTDRWKRLLRRLPRSSIVLAHAAPEQLVLGEDLYPYRQEPDYHYLSGVLVPQTAVLLQKRPIAPAAERGGRRFGVDAEREEEEEEEREKEGVPLRTALFAAAPAHPREARWQGATVGEAVAALFERRHPMSGDALESVLTPLLERSADGGDDSSDGDADADGGAAGDGDGAPSSRRVPVYVNAQTRRLLDDGALGAGVAALLERRADVRPLQPHLAALREVKSRAEVGLLRDTSRVAAQALASALPQTRPGLNEHQLAALVDFETHARGARRPAFPTIVAGGPHSSFLHYADNNDQLNDGELVLVDAGAELDGYASDITRTWPVGGTFSREQREVYEIVLEANERCIAATRQGATPRDVERRTTDGMLARLRGLGATGALGDYVWHAATHPIGLDVHDVASRALADGGARLSAGMVRTCEPGVYLSPDEASVPAAYRGIGVRIEDVVHVGDDGAPEVLTAHMPKSVAELEAGWRRGVGVGGTDAVDASSSSSSSSSSRRLRETDGAGTRGVGSLERLHAQHARLRRKGRRRGRAKDTRLMDSSLGGGEPI